VIPDFLRIFSRFRAVFSKYGFWLRAGAARFGPQKSHAGFPCAGQHGFLSHFL
jgi:hypothetical protein